MKVNKINIFVLIIILFLIQTISTIERYYFYVKPDQNTKQKLNEILIRAVNAGNEKIAKEAINQGADINYQKEATPLFFAAHYNYLNIVKLLIEKGADINKGYINGATPLTAAAGKGNMDIVKFLLDNGANPDITYVDVINRRNMNAFKVAKTKKHNDVANYIKNYRANRQKEIGKGTTFPSVLIDLVEEYTGYKEPSKEVHECQ